MLNQPISSSSHWRIPQPESVAQEAQATPLWQSALATAARVGGQALHATRPLWHAVVAGLLVGGVLVAPWLAMLALVGLLAPQLTGAHRAAPSLILVSLLWLALSIFGAHVRVERHSLDESDPEHP